MNYLAHTYLSFGDEYLVLGNFLADIISLKESRLLPDEFDRGFILHKKIDQFTDKHEEVKKVIQLLRPRHSKYSPVVSDILFDYYLAKNWESYSTVALRDFANNSYHILNRYKEHIPVLYRDLVGRMIKGDFLMNYGSKEGLAFTLGKMQQKAKFESNFLDALLDIEDSDREFNDAFNRFFPDLIEHVSTDYWKETYS